MEDNKKFEGEERIFEDYGFNPDDFGDEDEMFYDASEDEMEFEEDDESETGASEEEDKDAFGEDKQDNTAFGQDKGEEDDEQQNLGASEDNVSGREIGIDLGTTNSVVSYIDKNGATKFVKIKGDILVPSCIFYKDRDTVYYGKKAKSSAKAMVSGAAVSLFKKHLRADSEVIKVRIPKSEKVGTDGKSYYVVDTNVFIDQPTILDMFAENDVVILPLTVEQELEYRMSDINTKYSAEAALEAIIKEKENGNIVFAEADLDLLPNDFFVNFSENFNNANNDNKILSIALKYKEENVVLISSDNRLAKLKSQFVGVSAMTLKEFNLAKQSENPYDEFELTGTEASAMFLNYLKNEAEKNIKEPVSKAVITVPATFNLVEIENTKKAGLSAGFEEIHIEKEPTAAAIAYNIDADMNASTFIYDFGGGTFDVSIIKSNGDGKFEVCATAGNSKLGGEDLTGRIEEFVYDFLEDNYDISLYEEDESGLSTEHFAYNKKTIYWAAETCKMELSASENTTITLLDLYISDEEQKSIFIDMTRQEFESIIKPTITQTIAEMDNGLSKADMIIDDIDNIILAGGSSLIPCLQDQVAKYFGRKPSADKNAATLIAEGAAIIANALYGDNHLIKMPPQIFDTTFEDFGVALEKWNYSCIIPAGTTLPASAEKTYSLVEDEQKQLNIKVLSRSSEAQDAIKAYDQGVEYLDELIMKNLPPMKMDDVDVIVKFEITKQYELKTDVTLKKKDGTIIEKGNMSIDRQSML